VPLSARIARRVESRSSLMMTTVTGAIHRD
jgi:hypothetical protein